MHVLLGYSVWRLKFINFLLCQRRYCGLFLPPAARLWPLAARCHQYGTGQYPTYTFFQLPADFFFIGMTTSQELGHWWVSRFSDVAKLWNAKMKQKLQLFAIYQTATSLQRTCNLNPRTIWYPALDESRYMKSAYFIMHPNKSPPPQNGCRLKSAFLESPVSHPPLSQFNRTFHKTNWPPLH
jgi:hypothetical protein